MGVNMNLDFNLLETGSLFVAVLVTAFTLQVYYPLPTFDLHQHSAFTKIEIL